MPLPFRLRKDAHKWFKGIEKGLASEAPLFEMYYFCLAAGLAGNRKADAKTENTDELVDYFPGQYRAKGRVIVGWFLARELKFLGIKMHEREVVHMTIKNLVDPLSPSHLSDEGMRVMNRYSYGGFDLLTDEWFDAAPTAVETFLPLFKQKLDAGVKNG